MDSFIGLAKQGYAAYEASQDKDKNQAHTSGQDSNSNSNNNSSSNSYGGGGQNSNSYDNNNNNGQQGGYQQQQGSGLQDQRHTGNQDSNQWGYGSNTGTSPGINEKEAVESAKQQSGSGESSIFSSALSFLGKNQNEHKQPLDERDVQDSHRKAYDEGNAKNMSASSMGSAAAMQVLKKFTSGSSSSDKSSSSGGSQTQLISMAMAEAAKLFDKSGGASNGGKQDAVNGAAMTVMKLMVQSKFSGGSSGPNDSNSSGGLMKIASIIAFQDLLRFSHTL